MKRKNKEPILITNEQQLTDHFGKPAVNKVSIGTRRTFEILKEEKIMERSAIVIGDSDNSPATVEAKKGEETKLHKCKKCDKKRLLTNEGLCYDCLYEESH